MHRRDHDPPRAAPGQAFETLGNRGPREFQKARLDRPALGAAAANRASVRNSSTPDWLARTVPHQQQADLGSSAGSQAGVVMRKRPSVASVMARVVVGTSLPSL